MGRGNDGALDRVLDLPTNEAWIDPWVAHLRELGVNFVAWPAAWRLRRRARADRAPCAGRRGGRRTRIDGRLVRERDAGRARPRALVARTCRRSTRRLAAMDDLFTDWMVGIQFFLREPVDITNGHITFIDAPWALTALTQAQFWGDRTSPATTATATVVDCLSVDISNWDAPGHPLRQAGQGVHAAGDRRGGAGRRSSGTTPRGEAARRHRALVVPGPGRPVGRRAATQHQRHPAARQHGRLVGEAAQRRARRSRTCSWPATTCRPTSTWPRWRAPTSPAAPRSTRCWTRSGSKAEPAAMYKLYKPPEFGALKRADARAVSSRPAERARRTRELRLFAPDRDFRTEIRRNGHEPSERTVRPVTGRLSAGGGPMNSWTWRNT